MHLESYLSTREGTVIMNLTGEPEARGWELPAVAAMVIFCLVCLLYLLAFLYTLCCQHCGPTGPSGSQLCEENEEATFHPSSPLCNASSYQPDIVGLGNASNQAF